MWFGKQILSKRWIELSTSMKIKVPNENLGYGYLWWIKKISLHGRLLKAFYAVGSGGQYIWVVPDLKLVGVITADNYLIPRLEYNQKDFFEKYIVNALF
jgi:CubicO group peptidase (beta-lactamase class C family)